MYLYWRVFLLTNNSIKANKLKDTILSELNFCEILSLKPYWKDDELFELEFKQKIFTVTFEKNLVEIIKNVSYFSNSWTLDFPPSLTSGDFNISGVTEKNVKIQGVKWVSFYLEDENY